MNQKKNITHVPQPDAVQTMEDGDHGVQQKANTALQSELILSQNDRVSQSALLKQKLINELFYFDTNEMPKDAKSIMQEFVETFVQLKKDSNDQIVALLNTNQSIQCSEYNIRLLLRSIHSIGAAGNELVGEGVRRDQVRNRSYTPEIIKQFGTINCSGAANMFASIASKLGREVYVCNPSGHAANIIKTNGKTYYADPSSTQGDDPVLHDITDTIVYNYQGSRMGKIGLKKPLPIFGFNILPYYVSIQDGHNHMSGENHREMLDTNSPIYKQEQEGIELVKRHTTDFSGELADFESGKVTEFDAYKESDERLQESRLQHHGDIVTEGINAFGRALAQLGVYDDVIQLEPEVLFKLLFDGNIPDDIKQTPGIEPLVALLQNKLAGPKQINLARVKAQIEGVIAANAGRRAKK